MVLRVSPATFIGRVQELDEFRGVLANARLVTLTGTAGIGKTRMAIEVAGQVRRAFPEGVWFVPLADLEPAAGREALAAAAMAALGIDDRSSGAPEDTLLDFLRDRHLLLVLDNCEHVLQASAALAADILTVASDVRILATSRESLGIAGERTHVLPPLPLPEPGRPYELRELLRIESVRLLVERAQAVDARFTITEQDVADVAQLCSQLDGLPLAIELAATRLRSMSVGQMVERLEDRFSLLAAGDRSALPRQSSLRALIDWSYNLCAPRTRVVWTRLTVFPATLDCHAAEAVCGFGEIAPEEIFDHLDRLVAQSVLLTERSGGTIRYRLPTTLREYAVEYLEDPAALLTLRQRLRDHLLLKASATIASWAGSAQRGALTELGADHPSVESALGWSLATEGEREQGLRLATKFRYHWLLGGHLAVGRGWLERFLNVVTEASPSRGEALWTVAWVALIQGDRIGALRHLRDLAAIAKELEDPALATHVSHWTALHAAFSGDVEDSLPGLRRAVEGHRTQQDVSLELTASFQLAYALVNADHVAEALELCSQAADVAEPLGECFNHAWLLWVTGLGLWRTGELDAAEQSVGAALAIERDFQDRLCIALSVALLSFIATSRGEYQRAAELADLAEHVCAVTGTCLEAYGPRLRADADACAQVIASQLGARPSIGAWSWSGSGIPVAEVIDRALGIEGSGRPDQTLLRTQQLPMTARELEVARLVAEGLSNRQVAQRLVLSARTVDGHVQRILGKLGVSTRTGIATWILEHADDVGRT